MIAAASLLPAHLPLFIDPFLLFNSCNLDYQRLHDEIIRYLRFLRDQSTPGSSDPGLLSAWYQFGEVKQAWLGFSQQGNCGTGLGADFARALHENLATIFTNFGEEKVIRGSHLEKVCLVSEGVSRDNISHFTTNLIKRYLLEYTQTFARSSSGRVPERTGRKRGSSSRRASAHHSMLAT